ncbi:MAG: chromate transporter [Clostridia bacterium]|nr:chromate transporter [Clostridia bacterium]
MQFLLLFWEYFQIGLFTIGGGYAMLPMVQQVVERNGWMTQAELIGFVGIAESTPGPFAVNLATFVGMEVGKATSMGVFGGILGAFVATFAVVLPSFVVILIVTKLFIKFKENKYVNGAMSGIKPVVVGLILSAVLTIAFAVVFPKLQFDSINAEGFSEFRYVSLIMFAVLFVISRIKFGKKRIHPILIVVLSAVMGVVAFGFFNLPR